MKIKINDSFKPDTKFSLEENNGSLGNGILGKIKGEFFVPDGKSRNDRYYSKNLWQTTLGKTAVQEKLQNRGMFGTISHEQEINDTALLEGKISHVITNLWIDESNSKGMGEALILDTPAGKILNTVMRANAQLYTSSRAFGSLGENGMNGVPRVNEADYELETFDFVLNPGFLQARPKIAESLQKIIDQGKEQYNNNIDNKEITMSEKLIEKLSGEISQAKESLGAITESLENEKAKNKVLVSENGEFQKKYDFLRKRVDGLTEYKKLGTPQEISKVFDLTESNQDVLGTYKELGTPEEIGQVFERFENTLEAIDELGGLPAVQKSIDGSIKVLTEYLELGTPKEIEKVFEHTEKAILDKKDLDRRVMVEKISQKIGVPAAKIAKLYPHMNEEEITEFFVDQEVKRRRTPKQEIYKKRNASLTESLSNMNNKESSGIGTVLNESRGRALMDFFSK